MTAERVLITVKTYPTISAKHVETVCTGGINAHGEWRRIYPVDFRYLDGDKQYRVFDIVEVRLGPSDDSRPESRKPDLNSLKVVGHPDGWDPRCQWVNPTIEPSLQSMISKGRTLAPVAVSEVLEFVAKPSDADWTPKQKAKLEQELLFDKRKPLEKIPWEIRFRWKDGDNAEHDNLFLSWEVCQTYRTYRHQYSDPIKEMRDKWMGDICGPKKQVSFFMGNMARFRDNYLVCGTFGPPRKVAGNATLFG